MSRQDTDIDHLRQELLRRVEAHPIKHWSPGLLATMIAVLDLSAPSAAASSSRPALRVVTGGAR